MRVLRGAARLPRLRTLVLDDNGFCSARRGRRHTLVYFCVKPWSLNGVSAPQMLDDNGFCLAKRGRCHTVCPICFQVFSNSCELEVCSAEQLPPHCSSACPP